MQSIQKIELWYEPSDLLKKKVEFKCEMSREDHGFLCGMLRNVKPKKIVEIGVAEGGTTGVIMQCLSMLNLESSVYSVDLNENYYRDHSLKTGYEYEKLQKFIGEEVKHEFLFGKTIAGRIESIGKNIDMVIIDTMHILPGEVLDFLAVFPFLSPNAVVLLHDINFNYDHSFVTDRDTVLRAAEGVATKLLLMSVVADKYINYSDIGMGNIGAFQINQDTDKYICSLFMGLTLTWSYQMEMDIEQEYRKLYEKFYDKECLKWFDIAINNNRQMAGHIRFAKIGKVFPFDIISDRSCIVLYGAGVVGKSIYNALKESQYCRIVGWVDKNYGKYREKGYPVEAPSHIKGMEFDYILIAVERQKVFEEIKRDIEQNVGGYSKKIIGPIVSW